MSGWTWIAVAYLAIGFCIAAGVHWWSRRSTDPQVTELMKFVRIVQGRRRPLLVARSYLTTSVFWLFDVVRAVWKLAPEMREDWREIWKEHRREVDGR